VSGVYLYDDQRAREGAGVFGHDRQGALGLGGVEGE